MGKIKITGLTILKRVLLIFVTILLTIIIFAVGTIYVLVKGPSVEIRDLFVVTVMQSSAAKPLAKIFLSSEEVTAIMDANTAKLEDQKSNTDLIEIDDTLDKNAIIIEDVKGGTYKGKMMIVNDPSRVYVYCIPEGARKGLKVQEMVAQENAIAGVNGGGFYDSGGTSNGAYPAEVVISNGVWRNGDKSANQLVIGLDNDNKLVVGYMTGYEALERGIRDATTWGPALIVNGEPVELSGSGGLNPRTAIGQRADGAILLLVIDGRQAESLGASYLDLISIMQEYGAVNAANLDGGNSSSMVYEGEVITNVSWVYGERPIPDGILVKRVDEGNK